MRRLAGLARCRRRPCRGADDGAKPLDILAMPELDLQADVFRLPRHKTKAIAYVPATRLLLTRLRAGRERKARLFPASPIATRSSTPRPARPIIWKARASAKSTAPSAPSPAACRPRSIRHSRIGARSRLCRRALRCHSVDLGQALRRSARHRADLAAGRHQWRHRQGRQHHRHSLRTVQRMADKHYFVRQAGMSRAAGGQLETLMARIGYAGQGMRLLLMSRAPICGRASACATSASIGASGCASVPSKVGRPTKSDEICSHPFSFFSLSV
jgi:hypothetical protein